MADMASGDVQTSPAWRGFNHVALVTRDLEATMHFYQEVLGMELLFVAPANPLHGRHCGLRPGSNAAQVAYLHFFEYAGAALFGPHDRSLQASVFDPGSTFLSHISFTLPDAMAGNALQSRLSAHGVPMTPVMEQGDVYNLVFLDNNGLALEAAWSKEA